MMASKSRTFVFFCFFLLLSFCGYSQSVISGVVRDSAGRGIQGVNITFKRPGATGISGYSITSGTGNFKLDVSATLDSIEIAFSHIAFAKKTMILMNRSGAYSITLEPQSVSLKDVVVTASPIYKTKDTINYNVNAFTDKQDRVIGDIIKKLPGVEMRGEQILYNGQPLMKYYVNGLDMLSGQYNLINKNLPIDVVKKVQIIENDQPIKILDSLVFSNKASLNVQLKKFTTTGSGKVGAGFSPGLWDVNITPMTFNRSFQMLNSVQANNIGNDVAKQLKNYTTNDLYLFFNELKDYSGHQFTGVSSVSAPPFSEERWLDNNVKLVNSNMLQKFKSGVQLSGNISYYNDLQKRSAGSTTTIYLPGNELIINDDYNGKFATDNLQGKVNIVKNEKNIYLTDRFVFTGRWNKNIAENLRNGNLIDQNERTRDLSLSNIFTSTLFWGKKLVSLSSNTVYTKTPQQYRVLPGQFSGILNDSIPYSETYQKADSRNFYIDNNIGLTFGMKKFTLNTKFGSSYSGQSLSSDLTKGSEGKFQIPDSLIGNEVNLNSIKLYIAPSLQFQNKVLRIQFDLPVALNYIKLKDELNNKESFNNSVRGRVSPSLYINYNLGEYWQTSISSNYANSFGDISQMYAGYILTTFNSLQRRQTTALNEIGTFNNKISFNYKNTRKAIFGDLSFGYTQVKNNLLFRNRIDSSGFVFIDAMNQDNRQNSFILSAGASKFFGRLKTIVKVSGLALRMSTPVYVIDELYPQKTNSYTGRLDINNSLLKFLSADYHTTLSFIYSYLNNRVLDNVSQNSHYLDINLFPKSNQMFSIMSEYYFTKYKTSNAQYFVNLKYTYSIVKKRLDFELRCNNLLNSKNYLNISNSTYSITESIFKLRPRQFIASVKFTFN